MDNSSTQLVKTDRSSQFLDEEMLVSAPQGAKPATNELLKIHRLLRGRYKWAILLTILLGSGAAYAGFHLGRRTYQSTGVIQVLPNEKTVLYRVDDKDAIPNYDAYVDAQVALLKSQRVIDHAMEDPKWLNLGKKKSDEAMLAFAKSLDVSKQDGMIWVKCNDTDPDSAAVIVNAVITAYEKAYHEQETESGELQRQLREELRTRLENEWGTDRKEILEMGSSYGSDDLRSQFEFKRTQVNNLETAIQATSMAIAANARASAKDAPAATQPSVVLSDDDLALLEPRMAKLQSDRDEAQQRVASLKAQGILEKNHQLELANAALAVAEKKVRDFGDQCRSLRAQGRSTGVDSHGMTSQELEIRLDAYKRLYDDEKKEMIELGKLDLRIEEKKEQAAQVKAKLEEAKIAIEHTQIESGMTGRISVQSTADRPLEPFRDTRLTFAGAGVFGAIALSFGSMLLLGSMHRRLDRPDDADGSLHHIGMLGVLPRIPEDASNPEESSLASHCVHLIRTRLQILSQGRPQQVFAVTSPDAGSGKTSLTLALGVSFAAAHLRTLMIDCDLVGGGLTTRCNLTVRRKIGQILMRDGLITDEQLDEALKAAHKSGNRVGEALVDSGDLHPDNLESALAMQELEAVGIIDALSGEDIMDCITESGVENLWVLPLGDATAQHVSRISPLALRGLIDRARKHFDVVLIDTGPVSGSLEATVVSSEADQAILVVSRGDPTAVAEKAAGVLTSVGARVAGIVFNRARNQDVAIYGSSGFMSSSPKRTSTPTSVGGGSPSRLGPIGSAVVSAAPIANSKSSKPLR